MSRLSEIVVGLQRMGEAAQNRGADILYAQQVETHEHIRWLDDQLNMVEKVRQVLLAERKRFIPTEKQQVEQQPMPRIATKTV
jgi:macrodomain Ter protein organizer (MatP/YcbG family)